MKNIREIIAEAENAGSETSDVVIFLFVFWETLIVANIRFSDVFLLSLLRSSIIHHEGDLD